MNAGLGRALLRRGIGLVLLSTPAFLWAEVKKPAFDKNSPEGQYMELVGMESDSKKKLALLEQFLTLFPRSDSAISVWIYFELQDRYRSAGAVDKAIAAGEKILAIEPDNIEASRINWKLAEQKNDPALIKKWSESTVKIAERMVKAPTSADPEAMKAALQITQFAQGLVANSEFDEYGKALKIADPAQRLAALEAFARKFPQNPYAAQIEVAQFQAYREMGDVEKTLVAAERIYTRDDTRLDAMLFIAEINYRRQKDNKRTLELVNRYLEKIGSASRPEGTSEQEWTRSKSQGVLSANFMAGSIYFQAQQWGAADRALRAALPLMTDDQARAGILYNLGWANYQMQAAVEAIKFYRLCAAIPGPLRDQASKNVLFIKSEYNLP